MNKLIRAARSLFNSAGLDVVRYPPGEWVTSRYVLADVLSKLSVNVVLDVGANRGQYGQQLRDLGYKGFIFSFEPVRENFAVLSARAATSQRWKCFNYGLGATECQAEINVTEDDVFSSFLKPAEESRERFPANKIVRSELVTMRRLDNVLGECVAEVTAPRVYLKVDTQGYDLEVLAGASGVLDQIAGLQTEVSFRPIYDGSPGYAESLDAFTSQGFQVCDFMPVTRDATGLCAIEMDCIMARPGWNKV